MQNTASPDTNDTNVEAEIIRKGLTAPRVTKEHIDALMARVIYIGGRVGSTTSTVMHAFLDGNFLLASGHSACVSPENFDAELGNRMARTQAESKARDALWLLEGYRLRCDMATLREIAATAPELRQGWGFYTGTKELAATPMTRGEYNAYRGWVCPANEDPHDAGYLMEYRDGGKRNDDRHAGYISWSPADVFERTYKRIA